MAKLLWAVACERGVVDRYTENVSLHHVIEQVTIPEGLEPGSVVALPLTIVTLWMRDDLAQPEETATARLVCHGPDPKKKGSPVEFPLDLNSHKRFRHIARIEAFAIYGPGTYWLTLQLKKGDRWRRVGGVPVEAVVKPAPPVSP